jgi:hypothetical protein
MYNWSSFGCGCAVAEPEENKNHCCGRARSRSWSIRFWLDVLSQHEFLESSSLVSLVVYALVIGSSFVGFTRIVLTAHWQTLLVGYSSSWVCTVHIQTHVRRIGSPLLWVRQEDRSLLCAGQKKSIRMNSALGDNEDTFGLF